jgi:hypothetical protein
MTKRHSTLLHVIQHKEHADTLTHEADIKANVGAVIEMIERHIIGWYRFFNSARLEAGLVETLKK